MIDRGNREDRGMGLSALQDLLDRARSGDDRARNDLIRVVMDQFKKKVHLVLRRGNPRIGRFEDTDDILQEMLIRFDNWLQSDLDRMPASGPEVERWLESTLALNLRRVLVDRARKHYGRNGRGHLEHGLADDDPRLEQTSGPERRRRLRSLVHELIERLPAAESEVIDLRYYGGHSDSEIARLLKIDRGTVHRRRVMAEEHLGRLIRQSRGDLHDTSLEMGSRIN